MDNDFEWLRQTANANGPHNNETKYGTEIGLWWLVLRGLDRLAFGGKNNVYNVRHWPNMQWQHSTAQHSEKESNVKGCGWVAGGGGHAPLLERAPKMVMLRACHFFFLFFFFREREREIEQYK